MIEFARLWALAALPLPLLAWYVLPQLRARAALSVPSSVWAALDSAREARPLLPTYLRAGLSLRLVGWIALVVALSGPQLRSQPLVEATGLDVMIAVDLSASMGQQLPEGDPTAPTQIAHVREMLRDFVAERLGDRVGLIGFASEAYLIAPMSHDRAAVVEMLDEVDIGLPGRKTDLGQAIGLAVQSMPPEEDGQRVLLVISDGRANTGDLAALDAAVLAAERGIAVHMIGFAPNLSDENLSHLREIATKAGGGLHVASSASGLADVSRVLAQALPATESVSPRYLVRDLSWIPLAVALAAALVISRREVVAT